MIHAFFTKKSTNNEPVKSQEKLKLTSKIYYLRQVNTNKVIETNNTLNFKYNVANCLTTKAKQSL